MSKNPQPASAPRHPPGKSLALTLLIGLLVGFLLSLLLLRLAEPSAGVPDAPPDESWIEAQPSPSPPPPPPSEAPEPPARKPRQKNRITSVNVRVKPSRPAPVTEDPAGCPTRHVVDPEHRDAKGYPLPELARARIGEGAFALHGQIDQLEYLTDGEHLLARTFDGRLARFRVADGALTWIVAGLEHDRAFHTVPGRGGVAIQACEGLVLLDQETGAELERWPVGDIRRGYAITADGEAALGLQASRRDRFTAVLTRWNLPEGTVAWSRRIGRSHGPLALSDDGERLAVLVEDSPGNEPPHWLVADATSGEELRRLPGEAGHGYGLKAHFLPGTHTLLTSRRKDSVEAIAVDTGESFPMPEAGKQLWRGAVSADGTMAVNRGGVVFLLDGGEVVADLAKVSEDRNTFANLQAIAFSPDGTEVAATGRRIVRYHLRPGRRIFPPEDDSRRQSVLFLEDDTLVFQGRSRRLEAWPPPYQAGATFGPETNFMVSLGRGAEKSVTAWTRRGAWARIRPGEDEGARLARPPGPRHHWLTARRAEVLVRPPTKNSNEILILEGATGEPRRLVVEGEFRHPSASSISDDGRYLTSVGAFDQSLWDLATGEELHHLPRAFAGGFVPGSDHLFWYRPASRIEGTGRSSNGPAQLWRIGGKEPLRELPGNMTVSYLPEQELLVGRRSIHGSLEFLPPTGEDSFELQDIELRHVRRVAVSDDGARIVTIHQDDVAYVWDTATLLKAAGVPDLLPSAAPAAAAR